MKYIELGYTEEVLNQWRCAMAPLVSSKPYAGIDRRGNFERRMGTDRRHLVRYESIGSGRRNQTYRRSEDVAWSSKLPHI